MHSKLTNMSSWNSTHSGGQRGTLSVSLLDLDEHGGIKVESVTLDKVLHEEPVTFVGMAIEGGEPEAIAGAGRLNVVLRHVLPFSFYFGHEHPFTIPNKMRNIPGNYWIFVHRHGDQFGHVDCSAVPPECAADEVGATHV